jgi:hypothetical protein
MRRQTVRAARNRRAANIGDQRDMVAARLQLCGQGKGGDQMAAVSPAAST